MPTYNIPVTWTMSGHYEIKAESLERAEEKVHETGDLPKGQFVSGSLEINRDHLCYGEIC